MSGRRLYRVEWVYPQAARPARRSRLFAQRRAAVVFMFSMRRLGATATIASAPMPEWEAFRVTDRERDDLRAAIRWSTARRRAAQESARKRFGR